MDPDPDRASPDSAAPDPAAADLSENGPARDLAALGRLARDTRRALRIALLSRGQRLPATVQRYLEGTLDHLGHVREGFALTLRTDDCADGRELRQLVAELLIDWDWMGRLGIRWVPLGAPLERPVAQVVAYAHARVALRALPRLPEARVTFPTARRTYADIPVPRTPGEMLERIDEIERVVTLALDGRLTSGAPRPGSGARRSPPPRDTLRRTYGFFETSAWLVEQVVG